jgi:hypothetical protein
MFSLYEAGNGVLYLAYCCFLAGLKHDLLRTNSFQAPCNQMLFFPGGKGQGAEKSQEKGEKIQA